MPNRKSFGQFCGLARALDRVGDRWTLLLVRELLLGPKSFLQLRENLPGLSPSLLTSRISALLEDGIVERNDAPARSKAVTYSLSPAGQALEPAVLELIRWGSRWMATGPGTDRTDPAWAPLALRALLEGERASGGCVHLDIAGTAVTIRSANRRKKVDAGHNGRPDATVRAPLPVVLAVASGSLALEDSGAAVDGDTAVARALLAPQGSSHGGRHLPAGSS